jgi:hypothetical protein
MALLLLAGPTFRRRILAVARIRFVLTLGASGIRNCVGLAIWPKTGSLWCAANARDGMGDDPPPDFTTRAAAGRFYGYSCYYIGAKEDLCLVAGQRGWQWHGVAKCSRAGRCR